MHLLISLIFLFSINLFAKNLKEVSLQLHWKHQFEFAGYYIAKEKGFYKEKGLNVQIKEFDKNIDVINDVISQKSTFGINYPSLILEKANGKNILLISAILQSSPHALVTLKSSNINSLKDFEGKTLMVNENAVFTAAFISMLQSQKVKIDKIRKVSHTFNIKDLIEKKVDICSIFTTNELYELDKKGIDYRVWDPKDYGFDFYNDILFTSKELLNKNPILIEKFKSASLKGWEYAFSNIEETAQLIYKKYNSQNKTVEQLIYEAKELKKLAYYKNKKLGDINENSIQRIYDIYNLLSLSKNKIDLDEFIFKDRSKNKKEYLSFKEKFLLEKNTYNIYLNNWLPISIYDKTNNEFSGLSLDYWRKIQEIIPINSKLIYTKNFTDSLNKIKKDKNGIMISVSYTKQRDKFASFSKPYISYPIGIATQDKRNFIIDLSELENKKVAVGKNFSAHKLLQKYYPNIIFVPVKNTVEALELLAKGKVHAAADILITLKYYMQKYSYTNLKIAGTSDFKFDVRIMVNKNSEEIVPILNRAIDKISDDEKRIFQNKWLLKIKEIEKIDYSLIFIILAIFIVILTFILWRHKELSKYKNALEQKKKQLDDYINASTDFVWEINKDGVYVKVSRRVEEILGYKAKDMIGKSFFDFMSKIEGSKVSITLNELIEKKEPIKNIQNIHTHKDNSKVYLLTNAVPIFDKNEFIGYRGACKNITKEKQNDIIILEQSKMVAMGEMIGNIAHQWRQPLSLISTQATGSLFQKEMGQLSDKQFKENMDSINKSAQYLSETIDTFRNFIKKSDEKKYLNLSIKKEIDVALMITKASFDNNFINITLDYCKDDIFITLPQGELSQVILNILNNAKDAYKNSDPTKEKWVKITLTKDDKKVLICIEDNAGGIPDEIIDHIFEPYFTTKHKSLGTGLGLHMSYKIVAESMKGKLYSSNSSEGARFYIELPI